MILTKGLSLLKTAANNISKHFSASKFSTYEITEDIRLHTEKDDKFINLKSFHVHDIDEKPLVVLLPWLKAKDRHVNKFIQYYMRNEMDVLEARITPWQVMFPKAGSQIIARDLLKFLKINKSYSPLLIHGFSAGGYLWGEVLVQMAANTGYPFKINDDHKIYDSVKNRIVGQIWDSAVPFTSASNGIAATVFPNSKIMQSVMRGFINLNMTFLNDITTRHLEKSSEMFHREQIKVPAQIFVSKKDPIGCSDMNRKLKETWVQNGIQVYLKCWKDSPHVQHFHYHPEEYMDELNRFLVSLDLLSDPESIYTKSTLMKDNWDNAVKN